MLLLQKIVSYISRCVTEPGINADRRPVIVPPQLLIREEATRGNTVLGQEASKTGVVQMVKLLTRPGLATAP